MTSVQVESEVTGKVWQHQVDPGDQVVVGDVLIILESMKMEIPIESPCAGRVVKLLVREGDAINEGDPVAVIETG